MLQYHADNWDQLIKDDKVNTISLISHAVEQQHNEFEGISYAFWWFSVEHFLYWRGDKERDHKLLVYEVISPKNEHLINLVTQKLFSPYGNHKNDVILLHTMTFEFCNLVYWKKYFSLYSEFQLRILHCIIIRCRNVQGL